MFLSNHQPLIVLFVFVYRAELDHCSIVAGCHHAKPAKDCTG
jgi:hypothetical protein